MLNNKETKIRIGTFDLVKGLALFVIVCGHKIYNYDLNVWTVYNPISWFLLVFVYGINPLFFIIAGFGFKSKDIKDFMKKSSLEMLKPYIYVMVAYATCFPLIHYIVFKWWPSAVYETKRFLIAFMLGIPKGGKKIWGYEVYECSVVWFFLAMLIALNILNLIVEIKKDRMQKLIVFMCFFLGYVLDKNELNFFCIPQGLLGVGYCYLGYIIKNKKLYDHKNINWICLGLAIVSAIQGLYGYFSMSYGVFKYGFIECIAAACSGTLALFLGIRFKDMEWKCLEPIKKIGMYTYWIMCIHAVEMASIPWYYWSEIMNKHQLLGYVIELIITTFIIVGGCYIIKRITVYKYVKNKRKNKHERTRIY